MGNNPVSALLVVDVQQGLFIKSTPVYRAEALLDNINLLIGRARQGGAPIFFIQHSSDKLLLHGTPEWELHPRIQPQADECRLEKHHSNAFEGTTLKAELDGLGVTRVVVCGLVTHGCVKAACLGALELGYQVLLVQDAHSSYSKDAADLIEKVNGLVRQAGGALAPATAVTFA